MIGSAARADRFSVRVPAPSPRAGGAAPYVQFLDPSGEVKRRVDTGLPAIPVTARDRRVAAGQAKAYLSDREVDGDHIRVNTVEAMGGGAFQLGRSLRASTPRCRACAGSCSRCAWRGPRSPPRSGGCSRGR